MCTCMYGWGLFLGDRGEEGRMPFVTLLQDTEELDKPAQWLCASPLHGRGAQVCTSVSCAGTGAGGYFESLYPREGHKMGLIYQSPLQGDISAMLTKGGIMQLCVNGVCTLPAVGYSSPFHGRWDGARSVYLVYGLKSAAC